MLQFAVRLNGPMFASGLAFWQLGESNYWGHNAIIRLRPFAAALRAAAPAGRAAVRRRNPQPRHRRGGVHAPRRLQGLAGAGHHRQLGGSARPTSSTIAARDRRWAQGNLQHVGVMPMRGLHWLSRLHLLTGILSYVSSPLWLLVLIISSIVTCIQAVSGHQYFQPGALLAVSELAAVPRRRNRRAADHDRDRAAAAEDARRHAGAEGPVAARRLWRRAARSCGGCLLEQLLSMLLAPTMMLFHSEFVLRALLGRSVGWDAQPRGDRGVTWREALRAAQMAPRASGWSGAASILALAPQLHLVDVAGHRRHAVVGAVHGADQPLGSGPGAARRGWLLTPEETAAAIRSCASAAAARDRGLRAAG